MKTLFESHYPLVVSRNRVNTFARLVVPLNLTYRRTLARGERKGMEITFFLPLLIPRIRYIGSTKRDRKEWKESVKKREREDNSFPGLLGVFNIARRKESRLEGVALAPSILSAYSV